MKKLEEYKVVDIKGTAKELETSLNKLGKEGWKLVGVTTTPTGAVNAFLKKKYKNL